MANPDVVLDRARVREVTGVFHARERLNEAVEDLLLAGFDRADIDVMASLDAVRQRLGPIVVASEELADVPNVPRRPFIAPEDVTLISSMTAAIFAFVGGAAAALIVVMSRGSVASSALAALLGAAVAGGAAMWLLARIFRRPEEEALDKTMQARGIALWVRVHSNENEDNALRVLRRHGARALRVHEIDLAKSVDEIPLASLNPDPWLGNERLGNP
jgi:hypothetical protein